MVKLVVFKIRCRRSVKEAVTKVRRHLLDAVAVVVPSAVEGVHLVVVVAVPVATPVDHEAFPRTLGATDSATHQQPHQIPLLLLRSPPTHPRGTREAATPAPIGHKWEVLLQSLLKRSLALLLS
jgi:hypothetical protein